MRTTLTLDDDVAALLKRIVCRQKLGLKTAINQALRIGLRQMNAPAAPRPPYRTPSVDSGRCLLPKVDDIAEVLAVIEDDGRKLQD